MRCRAGPRSSSRAHSGKSSSGEEEVPTLQLIDEWIGRLTDRVYDRSTALGLHSYPSNLSSTNHAHAHARTHTGACPMHTWPLPSLRPSPSPEV